MLHKGCIEFLQYAKQSGFVVTLFTNGSLIDSATADILAGLNIGSICITLYGADPQTHDSYTGNPGSFNRVVSAITMLKERGASVTVRWNALPDTVKQTDRFISLVKGLGVKWTINGFITPRRDGTKPEYVTDDELTTLYRNVYEYNQPLEDNLVEAELVEYRMGVEKDPEMKFCGACDVSGRIDPKGILYPCIELHTPMGDLKHEHIKDVWKDESRLSAFNSLVLKNFPECLDCKFFIVCKNACPGTFTSDSSGYHPSHENCRNSKLSLRAFNQYLTEKVGIENNKIHQFMEAENNE